MKGYQKRIFHVVGNLAFVSIHIGFNEYYSPYTNIL